MNIFIASHGKLASGIKSSINILLGEKNNISIYDAFIDDTNLEDKVEKYLSSRDKKVKTIFLTDIYGGSVNQFISKYIDNRDIFLIAGINLPLVISILLMNDKDITKETLMNIVRESRETIKLVDLDEIDIIDEEFF
ncbi:PTS sugar transporter subunit IIA [Helcococcus kunzii]|uniref:PTS EIIA type-4 domain-containing protein n=1 Tax=Helcococcus kunzii ATCC 51366 TaxID=883114 RepID=H3NQH4_9FIRM|nr:hypothetical protein [Helcococcus kunzii]EHR32304.1 hypothetical protein HMPREF9709_01585 [Helcococcus kunzii ATCC 51366]